MSVESLRERIEQSETDGVAILRAARASVGAAAQALDSAARALDVVLGANDPEAARRSAVKCTTENHVGPFTEVFGGQRYCGGCEMTVDG